MSSQDYSPASYPVYAGFGAGETQPEVSFRTRERYWLYGLLFALTLVTATVVGAAMQYDFDRNLPFDIEHSFDMWTTRSGIIHPPSFRGCHIHLRCSRS